MMSDTRARQLKFMFIVVLALFAFSNIFAQGAQTVPTRQSSVEAFNKGNWEQAYNDFTQLLKKYPKDPLYKYYSGACLVMMKKDPDEALALLQQSVNGASVVRSLPPDALFYLGRAQQMSGKYAEAIASYSSYADQVGKKVAREQGVPGFIQECENRNGMVAPSPAKPAVTISTGKTVETKAAGNPDNKSGAVTTSVKQELPRDYEHLLDEALKLQYKADSLNHIADEQTKQLDKLPEEQKSSLLIKISQNEILAASYQKSADAKYNEAQSLMEPVHEPAPPKADTLSRVTGKGTAVVAATANIQDTAGKNQPVEKEAPATKKSVPVFSFFEILPKDAVYPDEKIKINPEVPAGLIYRIQLAVFRNPVAPSFFKGITPVYGIKVPGTDKTNYYAGLFRRSADAKKALQAVKESGFRDAFIVAVSDNKPVSADRAAVLENEWANRPLAGTSVPETASDTIPPTLEFRVEVARSPKPLKPDAVEVLKTLAGNRGLDILHLSDGSIVYLIGKFITFESAAEYADLLIRNNYREAKVVAWLGNKEIPVETAKQLFNNLQ